MSGDAARDYGLTAEQMETRRREWQALSEDEQGVCMYYAMRSSTSFGDFCRRRIEAPSVSKAMRWIRVQGDDDLPPWVREAMTRLGQGR